MAEDIYEERTPSGVLLLVLAFALLVALGGLVWSYTLSHRLTRAEAQLQVSEQENLRQATELAATDRRLRATSEELGDKLGITQRQIEDRAQQILQQQEAATRRLAQQEAETRKQVGAMSNTVSGVQTDVGGVKTDVANTKTELANTEQQLQHAIGDLGVQSGLIATNQQQLEYLKHIGDRTYYQFKLIKGARPQAVATVKLQLHKSDPKHSRYTLEVFSDDKKIEKKDRSLDEPVQFYSGKQPMLYELVINSVGKNDVSGYLSAPKDAPQPTVVP
ncbi:MAG TPA: hypothetical protein VMU62_08435 [Acidobacteriaceae bacterium]|nr:hypothetical protein [Acidobacteriaceae bacterium]